MKKWKRGHIRTAPDDLGVTTVLRQLSFMELQLSAMILETLEEPRDTEKSISSRARSILTVSEWHIEEGQHFPVARYDIPGVADGSAITLKVAGAGNRMWVAELWGVPNTVGLPPYMQDRLEDAEETHPDLLTASDELAPGLRLAYRTPHHLFAALWYILSEVGNSRIIRKKMAALNLEIGAT